MSNPVGPDDLAARWRPLSANELVNAQAALDDAWAVLMFYAPATETNLASGALSYDIVRAVVCSMVLRAMRNPDGAKSGTVSIDDFTRSWTLDSSVSSGALYVSNDELRWLGASRRRSGSFTLGSYTPPEGTFSGYPVRIWP